MRLISVTKSDKPGKRLKAVFDDGRIVHFGAEGGSTFIDHGDETKRANYIKRHKVNEDWTNPQRAGTLSRYMLWEKPSLREAVIAYKKRFSL